MTTMTTKQPRLRYLPALMTMSVLSAGVIISGCSDSDSTSAPTGTEEPAAVVETQPEDAASSVADTDTDTDTNVNGDTESSVDDIEEETSIDNDDINPITSQVEQKSLVTNPTQAGTPEDTVKKALDSLYYGDVKEAAGHYQVDMPNFEDELANTQAAFQQTVEGVTITDTAYNSDKTRATITGELMLKGQSEPAPLTYELQKTSGKWKILG